MTKAMPFLQKYDITFLRPPPITRWGFGVLYIVSNYLLSLIAACGAISKSGKLNSYSIVFVDGF